MHHCCGHYGSRIADLLIPFFPCNIPSELKRVLAELLHRSPRAIGPRVEDKLYQPLGNFL